MLELVTDEKLEELDSFISVYGEIISASIMEDEPDREELNNPPYIVWSAYMKHSGSVLNYHPEHAVRYMAEEYQNASVESQKWFFRTIIRFECDNEAFIMNEDFDAALWKMFQELEPEDSFPHDFLSNDEKLWRGYLNSGKTATDVQFFQRFVRKLISSYVISMEDAKNLVKIVVEGTKVEAEAVLKTVMCLPWFEQDAFIPLLQKRNDILAELPREWLEAVYGDDMQDPSMLVGYATNLSLSIETAERRLSLK